MTDDELACGGERPIQTASTPFTALRRFGRRDGRLSGYVLVPVWVMWFYEGRTGWFGSEGGQHVVRTLYAAWKRLTKPRADLEKLARLCTIIIGARAILDLSVRAADADPALRAFLDARLGDTL